MLWVEPSVPGAFAIVESTLLPVVLVRLIPVTIGSLARPTRSWIRVLLGVLCFAAAARDLANGGLRVLCVLVGGLYLVALTSILWSFLPKLVESARITRPALLALVFFAYVGVPATMLRPVALGATLLGWEAALSMYSYCVESSSRNDPRTACLAFVLVDPTVLYTARSTPVSQAPIGVPLVRLGVGFGLMAATAVLIGPAVAARSGATDVAELTTLGCLRFAGFYLAASGLAHVQIGAMALIGYATPERYLNPFLASNPLDFWRRWNVYVGHWLRRYIFLPTACLPALGKLRSVFALVSVFLAVGLLHDAYMYFERLRVTLAATLSFSAVAACTLFWLLASRAIDLVAGGGMRRIFDQTTVIAMMVFGAAFWM